MFKSLFIIIFSICATTCYAQSDKKEDDDGFQLPNGIRAGYQYSNLEKSSEKAANNLDWFYIGYVRKIKYSPLFSVQTGLEYMGAGAQESEETKLQLYYLVLPAQGVVKIGPFVGLAGVNGNFKIGERQTLNGVKVDLNSDNRSAFFDLAVDAGAGFSILKFTIEARYYWGLLDVNNGWHNRYWQAGLRFNF